MIRLTLLALTVLTLTIPTAAENIVFPKDAGVVDVTQAPYKAVGDGRTDVTAAIQKASTTTRMPTRLSICPTARISFPTRSSGRPAGTAAWPRSASSSRARAATAR